MSGETTLESYKPKNTSKKRWSDKDIEGRKRSIEMIHKQTFQWLRAVVGAVIGVATATILALELELLGVAIVILVCCIVVGLGTVVLIARLSDKKVMEQNRQMKEMCEKHIEGRERSIERIITQMEDSKESTEMIHKHIEGRKRSIERIDTRIEDTRRLKEMLDKQTFPWLQAAVGAVIVAVTPTILRLAYIGISGCNVSIDTAYCVGSFVGFGTVIGVERLHYDKKETFPWVRAVVGAVIGAATATILMSPFVGIVGIRSSIETALCCGAFVCFGTIMGVAKLRYHNEETFPWLRAVDGAVIGAATATILTSIGIVWFKALYVGPVVGVGTAIGVKRLCYDKKETFQWLRAVVGAVIGVITASILALASIGIVGCCISIATAFCVGAVVGVGTVIGVERLCYDKKVCNDTKLETYKNAAYTNGDDPSIRFLNLESEDKDVVNHVISTKKDEIPRLVASDRIISKVFHLLPHKYKFKRLLTVEIKIEGDIKYGLPNVILLYSASDKDEKPHWEIITKDNKSHQKRRVLGTTPSHCKFLMPTFCLVCLAELSSDDLHRIENPASTFDIHVGILFEAELTIDGECKQWLVKVRVLLSTNGFERTDTRQACTFKVVKDSIMGDVRVHMHDIKPEWALEDPEDWEDITVFQLEHGKRKEAIFTYYSENINGRERFRARVRLHQENAKNDCDVVLKDSNILNNMISKTSVQSEGHHTVNGTSSSCGVVSNSGTGYGAYMLNGVANGAMTPAISVGTNTIGGFRPSSQSNSRREQVSNGATNSNATLEAAASGSDPLTNGFDYLNLPTGVTANIPTFVQGISSSSSRNLENIFDELMDQISTEIDRHPTDDGVLQSLCARLQYTTDLGGVLHRARRRNVTPTQELLSEWKNKTGGNVRILRKVHSKYVN